MNVKRSMHLSFTNIEKIKTRLLVNRLILNTGCWYWTGPPKGLWYGRVYVDKLPWDTHRLSMRIFKPDEFVENLNVNHTCDSKRCFNPDHLYSGDDKQNAIDAINNGLNSSVNKTHCKNGHEFTFANTYILKGTVHRYCRKCKALRMSTYKVNPEKFFKELNAYLARGK